jgi:hypothetical protein
VEPNGWAASMPEVITRLSTGGIAVNVLWNVKSVITFSLARDGELG